MWEQAVLLLATLYVKGKTLGQTVLTGSAGPCMKCFGSAPVVVLLFVVRVELGRLQSADADVHVVCAVR